MNEMAAVSSDVCSATQDSSLCSHSFWRAWTADIHAGTEEESKEMKRSSEREDGMDQKLRRCDG